MPKMAPVGPAGSVTSLGDRNKGIRRQAGEIKVWSSTKRRTQLTGNVGMPLHVAKEIVV